MINHWKKNWNRIKGFNSKTRTQSSQVEEIFKLFDFNCFIDCGAGLVGSEAWSVRDMDKNCQIIGFEPQHERYDMLIENGYPDKLIKCALGDIEGEIEGFMGHEDGKSDFWLDGGDTQGEGAYKKEVVKIRKVDNVIAEYCKDKKVFIWADIEGSELKMLKGATKNLENGTIVGMNLELWNKRIAPNHCTVTEVVDFLKKYNYKALTTTIFGGTHKDVLFKKF